MDAPSPPPRAPQNALIPIGLGIALAGALVGLQFWVMKVPNPREGSAGDGVRSELDLAVRGDAKSTLTKERYAALLAKFRAGAPDAMSYVELHGQLLTWFVSDPQACSEFLSQHGASGLITPEMIEQAIQQLGKHNALLPLGLSNTLPNGSLRERWIRRSFLFLVEADPRVACERLSDLPLDMRDRLADELALRWGKLDGEVAIASLLKTTCLTAPLNQAIVAFSAWSRACL